MNGHFTLLIGSSIIITCSSANLTRAYNITSSLNANFYIRSNENKLANILAFIILGKYTFHFYVYRP